MEDGGLAQPSRGPRYEGEDLSPTTIRELRGFYAYGLAAEVFAVCGVGTYHLFQKFWQYKIITHGRFIPPSDAGAAGTRAGSFVVR